MSVIRFKKTVFTAVLSVAVCLGMSVCAEPKAIDMDNITVLGDSISTGYGLDDDELSYCEYLQEYFDAKLDNFAVNGRQTADLIKQLDEDKNVKASLKNADLVCVTIGGNDILHIFEDALYELNGLFQSDNGQVQVSSEFTERFLTQFSSGFGPAAAQAKENMNTISEKISDINSTAFVVFQTVYNPFKTDDEALNNIMKPLNIFTSIYLRTINNSVKQQPVIVADINSKLNEKSWLFTNIKKFDIHPNYLGHMLIAEEIVQKLSIPGNYEVFEDAVSLIPETELEQIPENILSEVKNLGKGSLRIESGAEAFEELTEETEETTSKAETKESSAAANTGKSGKRSDVSNIFLKTGICLVIISLCLKIYSNKRKDKK